MAEPATGTGPLRVRVRVDRDPAHRGRCVLTGLTLVAVAALTVLAPGAGATARSPAGGSDDAPTTSVVPETTSTLPTGGDMGRILPRPNSGQEPQTPGDPGGSQQVGLFFGLCAVIAAMVAFGLWRSRVARARRAAEGRDPVELARRSGGDVRKPRPPGIQ